MSDEAPPPAEGEAPEDGEPEPEPEPPFTLTISVKAVTPLVPKPEAPEAAEGEEEPAPPAPLEPAVLRVTFPGEQDPIETEEPCQANEDGSYTFDFERSFEREPGAALMNALINEPAVLTVVVGETELARCVLDLAPFTTGALIVGYGGDVSTEAEDEREATDDDRGDAEDANGEDKSSSFLALEPVPFPVAEPPEEGAEAPEPLPSNPLLPTAAVAFSVTASKPFVEPDDAKRGLILTLAPTEIAATPPSLSAYEDLESYPFVWAFGVPLPGLEPAVVTGGRLRRRAKDATRRVGPQGADAEVPEGDDPESESRETEETYVSWSGPLASRKFWLPASSVDAFRESIKGRGKTLRFEVARYPAEAPETTPDPVYANYHAVAECALEALLDPGATECAPERAFLKAPAYGARSCLPPPAACPEGAAAHGDEPAVPPGAVAWAAAEEGPSRVAFAVTTTRPLLPPFRPPAPAETTVEELLPARSLVVPEAESVEAAAAREFREEVTRASLSLAEEYAAMFTGAPAETDDQPNGASQRRKRLVFELNRSGKYHDMKERLKDAASKIVKSRFFVKSTVRPDDREELDAKYDELYVHLVEEMHAALADLGSTPEETAKRKNESEAASLAVKRASLAQQRHLADEYEINQSYHDAEKWHQERVLLSEKKDANVWCAYGFFLARRGRHGAAEEAFKEALLVDETCVEALRALTVLMLRDEEYHRAEVFGQAIVTEKKMAPGDAVAWTLLALAYEYLDRETDKDNCAFEARRLTATAMANLMGASPSRGEDEAAKDEAARTRETQEMEELVGPASHVKTALLCLDMHLPSVARDALDLCQLDPDDPDAGLRDDERLVHKLCLARAAFLEAKETKGRTSRDTDEDCFAEDDNSDDGVEGFATNDLSETDAPRNTSSSREEKNPSSVAFGFLMDALSIDATDPRPFELLGDVHKHSLRFGEAEEAYTHAMACSGQRGKPPASLKLFLNLGEVLLKNGKISDARGAFAAACEMRPCASTWIGLGKAMISEGDLEGAEAALAEANVLDATNPNAWTQLAIVSLLTEPPREDEAERAIGAAFKRGVDDAEALADVARLFLRVGGWKHAEAAARRAVKHGAGVETRLCLARASRERGDAEGAAAELKYALALAADEGAGLAPRGDEELGDDDEGGGGAVGVPFLVPELLEELAGVYDELGDARRAEECRRDLRALQREQ